MRIRLATIHPLPPFKCWHFIPTLSDSITIQHLIEDVIETFSLEVKPCQLSLELDGFYLPLKAPICKILRENDLIILKQTGDSFNEKSIVHFVSEKYLSIPNDHLVETNYKNDNEAKNDIDLLKNNEYVSTINNTVKRDHDLAQKIVQGCNLKRKLQYLENENESIKKNNLINFDTLENEITLNAGKKIQISKKKISPIELNSQSSASSSSTKSSTKSSSLSTSSTSATLSSLLSVSSTSAMSSSLSLASSTSESSSISEKDSSDSSTTSRSTSKINQIPLDNKNQKRAPPGQGSLSTKARNMRKKRTKKLLRFKQQGILPDSATFADLLQIEERINKNQNKDIEIKPLKKYIKNKSKGFISKIGNTQNIHIKFDNDGKTILNNKINEKNWEDRCIVKEIECEIPNVPIQDISITPNKNKELLNKISPDRMPPLPENIETLTLLTEPPPIGSIVAFKHLSMNNNYEPILSDYKTAIIIDNSPPNILKLELAKRDRKEKKIDPETGEYIYGKFGVDTDIEQNGQLILAWEDLVSPVLLQKM
ncbi:unnamed protein product [Pneumocystis jirovecii]|uniref:Coilin n=1 Tax=Pneumocystis jirovecii TaxID=42068 RepID=L0PBP6_PNEJI|nr:unnamed protein product [Pneumocystis jirovecii]